MNREIMICVAPVPGEKQDEKYPGAIDVPAEAIACEAAGAAIVHLHARDEDLRQTTDPTRFQQHVRRIRAGCPIVIEGSTGGAPEHSLEERCVTSTAPEVELGSLNVGSVNLFDDVYQNSEHDMRFFARKLRQRGIAPDLVIFDLSHLHNARRLIAEGEVVAPFGFAFVFDLPGALPYSDRYLELLGDHVPPGVPWFCLRHHARGAAAMRRAMELGGHLRVGFEDGPFLSDGRRARNNVELVADAVEQAKRAGRTVVRATRARELLGLRPLPAPAAASA